MDGYTLDYAALLVSFTMQHSPGSFCQFCTDQANVIGDIILSRYSLEIS